MTLSELSLPDNNLVPKQSKYPFLNEIRLGPTARKVAEYVLDHPRAKQIDIAKALGIKACHVSKIVNTNKYLSALPGLARRKIKSMVPLAVQRQQELMEQNVNLEVSRKVSASVLESQKVLESTPSVQVNVYQNMKTDDLLETLKQFDMPAIDKTNAVDAEIIDGK